jgi:hypothetical protein
MEQDMTYKHLTLWTRPDSYMGPDWDQFYVVMGQNRDSNALSRSNWTVALERLQAEEEKLGDAMFDPEGDSYLQIVRDHHWAVGWVEFIYLHQVAPASILELADGIREKIEDYPVLDEKHFSNLEYEEADANWACMSVRERIKLIREYAEGVSIFAARRDYIPSDDSGSLFDYLRG